MRFFSTSSIVTWATAALSVASVVLGAPASPAGLQKRAAVVPTMTGSAAGMAGANTYGRASVMNDGSLLGSATYFQDGNNIINAIHSTDGGATWTILGQVTSGASDAHDIDNAYLQQLPSGRILASFRNNDKSGSAYTYYRITICYSEDGGVTWQFLSQAAEQAAASQPNGLWEPFLRVTGSGAVQVYYSRENNANDQDLIMSSSTDQGATWSAPVAVIGTDKTDARDGMIGIAANGAAGNLFAVFESVENGIFQVQKSESSDDGSTWGPRGVVYAAPNGLNAQSPQVANVGGALVAIFMTNEDSGVAGTAQEAVKIVTSGDGGNTWGNKLTVGPAPSFWPGVTTTGNNNFIAIYGTSDVVVQEVTLS